MTRRPRRRRRGSQAGPDRHQRPATSAASADERPATSTATSAGVRPGRDAAEPCRALRRDAATGGRLGTTTRERTRARAGRLQTPVGQRRVGPAGLVEQRRGRASRRSASAPRRPRPARRRAGRRPASGRCSAGPGCPAATTKTVFSIARARTSVRQWSTLRGPGDPGRRDDEHLGARGRPAPGPARGSAGRSRSSARPRSPPTSTTTGSSGAGGEPVGLAVAEGVVEVDLAVRRLARRRAPPGC